jgi:hypothetical protein
VIAVAILFGFLFVKTSNDLLAMGELLGIASASFGAVACAVHRVLEVLQQCPFA